MYTGSPDLCAELDHKSKEAKERLEMIGFPTECPVKTGRKCFDGEKKVDMSKYKNFLAAANGKMDVESHITHDSVSWGGRPRYSQ